MHIRYKKARWYNEPSIWLPIVLAAICIGILIGHHATSLAASRQRAALLEQIRALEIEAYGQDLGNWKIAIGVPL